MAWSHNAELQHSNYFLIMHGKEHHSQLMNYDLTIPMTTWSPDWGQSDFQYWVDIIHQFSMELHSTSDSTLIPIFKHWLPICLWISHLSSNDHHSNSLQHIAFNHHVQPRCPQVCIRGSLGLRDGWPHQAQTHPQVEIVYLVTLVYSTWAVPHHGTSYWSWAYSYGTHCGLQAYCTYIQWYCHHSHDSYWPTISSMFMTPKTINWERTS